MLDTKTGMGYCMNDEEFYTEMDKMTEYTSF